MLGSPHVQALSRAATFASAVAIERWTIARGRRQRVQRVDARTGAPPSLRQTIVVLGAQNATRWLLDRALPKPGREMAHAAEEQGRELKRVSALYADDEDARQEAIVRVYAQYKVQPAGACLPVLIRGVAGTLVNRCPIPFLSGRRTLADVLAGTKTVRNGPSRWERLRQRRAAAR